MVQIIEENKRPSFMQHIMGGLADNIGPAIEKYQQNQNQTQQNKLASQLLGFDASSLDPQTRNQMLMESFKQQGAENIQRNKFANEMQKNQEKQLENLVPLQGAMDTLNRMKLLRKKGNLGIGSTYSPFEETRKQAGEYEQLGKSLIQYSTNIPIRNRIEFETLAEGLYDPTITDAKAEGILNAMERIIKNSLQAAGGETFQNQRPGSLAGSNQRPPISSFKIGAK